MTKARFRLRSILLFVNLTVLLLPLLGLFFFRFYENELVRQTEIELISQAAVISAVYKHNISAGPEDMGLYGLLIDDKNLNKADEYYTPVPPQIDLSTAPQLPPRPDGRTPEKQPDRRASAAGKPLSVIITESQKITLSAMKILDYNGIVVAGRTEVGLDFSFLPEIRKALSGLPASLIRLRISDEPAPALASISRSDGIRVFVALPIIQDNRVWGVVYLSRTPQNTLKHLYAEKEKVMLTAAIFLALTMLLALLTSYMISRPLHRLINKTRKFAAGDLSALDPMTSPGVKEIELLSTSFSNMAQSLLKRADYIREFAMNVSHEFKTPMTSIQGSAELLLEHLDDMEPDKKRKFLANIIADSDRLKRLINRLLELAKADNFTPANETVSLYPVLDDLKGRYSDLDLTIEYKVGPEITLPIAREHLETIFVNLCDNAGQHGATTVTFNITPENNNTIIRLSDNGTGISPANADKVFTPFFTTKRSNGGTGLGLRIVKSLLEAHGGSVRLAESNKGTCFEVSFPRF